MTASARTVEARSDTADVNLRLLVSTLQYELTIEQISHDATRRELSKALRELEARKRGALDEAQLFRAHGVPVR